MVAAGIGPAYTATAAAADVAKSREDSCSRGGASSVHADVSGRASAADGRRAGVEEAGGGLGAPAAAGDGDVACRGDAEGGQPVMKDQGARARKEKQGAAKAMVPGKGVRGRGKRAAAAIDVDDDDDDAV